MNSLLKKFYTLTLVTASIFASSNVIADTYSRQATQELNNALNRLRKDLNDTRIADDPRINGPIVRMSHVYNTTNVFATYNKTESCQIYFDRKIQQSTYSKIIYPQDCLPNKTSESLMPYSNSIPQINSYYFDLLNDFPDEVLDMMLHYGRGSAGFEFRGLYIDIIPSSIKGDSNPSFMITFTFKGNGYPWSCSGRYGRLDYKKFSSFGCFRYNSITGKRVF